MISMMMVMREVACSCLAAQWHSLRWTGSVKIYKAPPGEKYIKLHLVKNIKNILGQDSLTLS